MARLRSVAVGAGAMILLGGAVVLAALQVHWVTAASRDEEAHLRATVDLGLVRVRRDLEEDLRALGIVLRLTTVEVRTLDWSGITDALGLWYANAPFPGLLDRVYLIPDPAASAALTYDSVQAVFRPTDLPEDIATEIRALQVPSGTQIERKPGDTVVLLPVRGQTEPGTPGPVVGAVALRLDSTYVCTVVVPRLVERHLAGFPYRIVTAGGKTVLHQSDGVPTGARPEATLGLTGLAVGDARWMADVFDPRTEIPSPVAPAADPALRSWLVRLRAERIGQPQRTEASQDDVSLEVFYPGGSIASAVQLRRAVNLWVGGGILAALLLSALILYRLYRRSLSLRASEQEFVATVSHELRTPITVIQAASENLKRGIVHGPDHVARYGGVINEQARRLSGMVQAILHYSGVETGRGEEEKRSAVCLADLVQMTLEPLESAAAEHGKEIRVVLGENGQEAATVETNPTAVRLVLENLVMNAIHHASPGEVRVRVYPQRPTGVRVVVEDDGPGIPGREQARVFEPFVRGQRSVRDQHPGSGLGLHLVRRVARSEGGEVRLESPYTSAEGERCPGCRFQVRLP